MTAPASARPAPELLLDLPALAAAELHNDPFEYVVVPRFVRPERLEALNRDWPVIDRPGNWAPGEIDYGPEFAQLLEELESPEVAAAFGRVFGLDLVGCPTSFRVRSRCEASDGHIHTDHWTKLVTILIYPNPEWTPAAGRLRLLRSADDLEDYAHEVIPEKGTLLAFRRSDRSFHGHHRHEGDRRLLQMSWVRPSRFARAVQAATRVGTRVMKSVGLHRT